jgi:hypothetical protein
VTAATLLAELNETGIHLTREGDNLRVRATPGISLAPYVKRITAQKAALLRELLQRRIIQALDVEPAHFDREEYNHLCVLWHVHESKEEPAL